ncbi:enhancer of split mgamma protein-like [Mercenaria mercenaria]|uniref:enhancer of split mgamma protein-like n=1 Tax=Mercenaria mercenaria TaxID=6596 RepID=UPI00234F640E|nr:enhancer of split mgamma protein-like [Mercenaria mercenaria]
MDEMSDKKEKVTPTRRTNKPLMEKRRRARINDCLVQLKSLVLQAMNKDTTQYSKLEKADILEMTVKHLKIVQRQQMTAAMATDPNVISKYRAGFNECASEIARYLDTVNGGNPELKARVMNYLGNSMMQFPVIPVYQGVVPPYHIQMTSPATSHAGFGMPSYSHGNNAFSSPHQHPQSHLNKHSREFLAYSHGNDSAVKLEPSPVNVNVDIASHMTSHTTSPIRRIPSPCDSDSGLRSDSSFSHDENGNYSHYNINQDLKNENEARHKVDMEYRHSDSKIGLHGHKSEQSRHSPPKRKNNSCNESLPKRLRPNENVTLENETVSSARDARENDPMWRPW